MSAQETAAAPPQYLEVVARKYSQGTTVTNCVAHMHLPVTERPHECRLCLADVANALHRAFAVNEWLNEWREDALVVLQRQAEALDMLRGWEARPRTATPGETAVLHRPGEADRKLAHMPHLAAVTLEDFFEDVVAKADGIDPDTGGTDGPG